MKAELLHKAGEIEAGEIVEVGGKTGINDQRGPEDRGGVNTTRAPVYTVTDKDGQAENVDTRDLKIVR